MRLRSGAMKKKRAAKKRVPSWVVTDDFWARVEPLVPVRDWRSTTRWRESPGDGRALTGPCSRPHWRKSRSAPTRLIGGKNGSKRHLLVDGRGVPLSLVVTGANRHDVSQLEAVLSSIMVKREMPAERRSKHLWLDAGYRGEPALKIIEHHGYVTLVGSPTQEN